MLTILDSRSNGTFRRREFLRVGVSALGGLSLASLLAAKADASLRKVLRDRSVVVLNLQGGPTQFETLDPKMTAPREVRSISGEVATAVPGVTFGGSFPRLATLADKMAVVRSYRHGISRHGPAAMHVMAGGIPTGAMMGALFSRVAGLTSPATGMPNNALITSRAMGPEFEGIVLQRGSSLADRNVAGGVQAFRSECRRRDHREHETSRRW